MGSAPGTPQRVNSNSGPKTTPISSVSVSGATALKRNMAKLHSTANASFFNASDAITVVVPRSNGRLEQAAELRKEGGVGKMMPLPLQTKTSEIRKFSNLRDDLERPIPPVHPEADGFKVTELSGVASRNVFPAVESSAAGNPEADMNRKDGKCIVSGRLGTNLKMEPLGGYQHDGCMCAILC